jgi:hypothetical protein
MAGPIRRIIDRWFGGTMYGQGKPEYLGPIESLTYYIADKTVHVREEFETKTPPYYLDNIRRLDVVKSTALRVVIDADTLKVDIDVDPKYKDRYVMYGDLYEEKDKLVVYSEKRE